jgi:hypothetical protein
LSIKWQFDRVRERIEPNFASGQSGLARNAIMLETNIAGYDFGKVGRSPLTLNDLQRRRR